MIAIISDVHSNLAALHAVLNRCEQLRVTEYLCLGDTIGYGPDPIEVIDLIRAKCAESLMGNHEEALVTGTHNFNPRAAQAIDWTRKEVKLADLRGGDRLDWFSKRRPFILRDELLMVHGSIYDPVHDYVDEPENPVEAQQMIETLERDFAGFDRCFAGHNHTPFLATTLGIMIPHDGHRSFRLPRGHKAYICVGSVGQPRDRDARASFATLDGELLTFHRVGYDIPATQRKIIELGLNRFLAERLEWGV